MLSLLVVVLPGTIRPGEPHFGIYLQKGEQQKQKPYLTKIFRVKSQEKNKRSGFLPLVGVDWWVGVDLEQWVTWGTAPERWTQSVGSYGR